MAYYSLVPFEGSVWLIRADQSMALTKEQLENINKELESGKKLADIQELLENVWSS